MIYKMISEKEFDEILKKKGIIEECRKLWWKHWKHIKTRLAETKNRWKIL